MKSLHHIILYIYLPESGIYLYIFLQLFSDCCEKTYICVLQMEHLAVNIFTFPTDADAGPIM